jgi:peptidoglycan/xylan/chitin deacetylase (PgdA/CDA1 family)
MYHDVVAGGGYDLSGFSHAHAEIYKLPQDDFAQHLEAIFQAAPERSVGLAGTSLDGKLLLTFDDGGVSAYDRIAPMLEHYGWPGHFFVTTDWIGQPGFLNMHQIRELDRRGHLIGSHSCSHPTRMAQISKDRLFLEWRVSVQRLAEIVGHPVTVASVPGGYYSQRVAEAAADAGIDTLFTSEPTSTVRVTNGCLILGRYAIQRWMGPEWSGGFAGDRWVPQLKQALLWRAKQIVKVAGGNMYLRAQEILFSTRRR